MSGSLSLNGTWGLTYTELLPEHYTGTELQGRRCCRRRYGHPSSKC